MKICMNEDKKIVEIWLTNAEREDAQLRDSLNPLFKEYKIRKYTVAVFLSGKGDLFEGMRDLIIHNRKVLARKISD